MKNRFWDLYDWFFFDFDGVLVDTLEIKAEAFADLFMPWGASVAQRVRDHHLNHGGMSRFDKFKYYYREFLGREIDTRELNELNKRFSDLVVKKVINAPFLPGAKKILELCRLHNKECFLISATPQDEIRFIVERMQIADYFWEILGSPNKKEENLKGIIYSYQVDVRKAIYFGDSKSDLNACRICGIRFVGINYFDGSLGYRDFEEFMKEVML